MHPDDTPQTTERTDHAAAIRGRAESLRRDSVSGAVKSWPGAERAIDEIIDYADALAAERDALREYARALEYKIEHGEPHDVSVLDMRFMHGVDGIMGEST
jgi:hypothetical protein